MGKYLAKFLGLITYLGSFAACGMGIWDDANRDKLFWTAALLTMFWCLMGMVLKEQAKEISSKKRAK